MVEISIIAHVVLSSRLVATASFGPIYTYGALVWETTSCRTTIRKEIEGVQKLACIGITSAIFKIMLGLQPLDFFIKKIIDKSYRPKDDFEKGYKVRISDKENWERGEVTGPECGL